MAFDVLDPNFGTGGVTRFDNTLLTGTIDYTGSSIVASDGKVIVAASSDGDSVNTFVTRYNTNGTIDTTFGVNGTITLPELGSVEMALASTGDLILLGGNFIDQVSGNVSSRLYRFTPAGTPVTSFGNQGIVDLGSTTTFETYAFLEVSSNGSILVVGSEGFNDTAILYARRLTSAGAPDTTFGAGGKRVFSVPGFGVTPTDTELDASGRLVIVGQADSGTSLSTAVLRVNVNGTLDSSFDGDGRRVFNMGVSGDDNAQSKVAIASDGAIFVSSINISFTLPTVSRSVKVSKLTSTGSFVTAFGGSGIITLPDVAGNKITAAASIVFDPVLGLALGVETDRASIRGSGLVRLNPTSGAMESTFGTSGLALIPFFGSSLSFPNSLSILNGEFTVSGTVGRDLGVNLGVAQVVGTTGALDTSFGTRGRLSIDYSKPGTSSTSADLTLAMDAISNGSVFLVGATSSPFGSSVGLVTKLRTTGTVDTSFGLLGRVAIESLVEVRDVVAANDGSLIVAGALFTPSFSNPQPTREFAIVKLRADGDIDTTFGVGGYSIIDFGGDDTPVSLVAGGSGKWIVAGTTTTNIEGSRIAVARLNANGSLDTSFDGDGKVVLTTGPSTSELATDVKVDPTGRIVVVGSAGIDSGFQSLTSPQFLVARFLATGALDTAFNGTGVVTRTLGVANESYFASSLEILGDSSLIVGGSAVRNPVNDSDFLLMAFSSTGAVRNSFGVSGAVRTDFPRAGGSADLLFSTIRTSSTQIIAVGASFYQSGTTSRRDTVLTAYNPITGALDPTFAAGTNSRLTVPIAASTNNSGAGLDVVGGLLYVGGTFTSGLGRSDMFVARYGQSTPVVTGVANAAYVENAAPVRILPNASVTDLDAKTYGNGSLSVQFVSGQETSDILSIRSVGTASGQVSLSGSNVLYQGIVVGTWTGGTTTPLQVLFNAQSSTTSVTAILRNITFATPSDTPSATPRVVRFTVVDGSGLASTPVTSTISVTPVNDAPTIAGVGATVPYSTNSAAVLIAGGAIIGDLDHNNFNGGQLSLRFTSGAVASNRLTFSGVATVNASNQVLVGGIVIGTLNAGGGVGIAPLTITFSANATTDRVQTLLRNIRFSTVSGVAGTRTLEIALTDPGLTTTKINQSIVVS